MEDKNYWLQRWYERRFLNRLWEIYPDGEWSWHDIIRYVKSGRLETDLFKDLSLLAQTKEDDESKYIVVDGEPFEIIK